MEEKHVSKKFKGGSGAPILIDEEDDEDLKRAIELSLQDQDPNSKSNTNTSSETKKRKHDAITEVKEYKSSSTAQDWTESQLFFRLHRIRGIYPKGNVEALAIQQLITPDAKKALLTTYKLELEWLLKACPILLSIPTFISHGEDAEMLQNEYIPDNVKLSTPKTSIMYSVNHGKIMLIEYEKKLRVVVSTANLLSVDYDRKTQGLWCQDFPKLDPEKIVAKKIYNSKVGLLDPQNLAWDFQMTLEDYLKHLGINNVFNLNHYDFSKVRIVLIPTVPGTHKYGNENKYGHLKLKKFLSGNPIDEESFAESNYALQFSSVGALSEKWFNELKQSLSASSNSNTTSQTNEKKEEKGKKKKNSTNNDDIQLVWPTVDYVKDSIDGYMAGGSLCFSNKNLKPFLSSHFHVYEPPKERRAIPPHIKCYTRYNKDLNMAWVLLSSANLSKGAMGELQKDGSQFMLRNFEMGVLFLPSLAKDSEDQVVEYNSDPENTGVHIEDEKESKKKVVNFPFPYKFPPKKYDANDTPWIWDVKYNGPDIFGNNWPIGFM